MAFNEALRMSIQSICTPAGCSPEGWPTGVPSDLALQLQDKLARTAVSSDDLWQELRDWLVRNGVYPTFSLDVSGQTEPPRHRKRRRSATENAQLDGTARRNSRYDLSAVPPELDHAFGRLFEEAEEKRRIVDLENAILDYALRFGVTDAARAAIRAPLRR